LKVRVILNRAGGSAGERLAERIRELFAAHKVEAELRLATPAQLDSACREAGQAGCCDVLVAAGGDGTVGAAAGAIAGSGIPLGILPLGTFNHFARDAGIPLDLDQAVACIAAGRTRRVDVGEVNGRIFVNNSAVGLYPMIVREREAQQRRLGRSKRLAMLVASLRALWRFSRRRLVVRVAGQAAPIETPLLFVGNNRYETALLSLGRRIALDRGELCLYAPLAANRARLLALALRALFGRLDQQLDFISLDGLEEVRIGSRRRMLLVAADGEARPMATPLVYRSRPGALTLIVPAPSGASPGGADAGR
jgi:diacylglycerol kinase family enzyme